MEDKREADVPSTTLISFQFSLSNELQFRVFARSARQSMHSISSVHPFFPKTRKCHVERLVDKYCRTIDTGMTHRLRSV